MVIETSTQEDHPSVSIVIKIIASLIAFAALVVSGYAFIFVLFGMLPTIVAMTIDRRVTRSASNTIGAFNLMGVMPYLIQLWNSSDVSQEAQHILTDVYVWFYIYSAAALGWIMIWIMPQIWANIVISRAHNKVAQLEQAQEKLVEEWGEEVRPHAREV